MGTAPSNTVREGRGGHGAVQGYSPVGRIPTIRVLPPGGATSSQAAETPQEPPPGTVPPDQNLTFAISRSMLEQNVAASMERDEIDIAIAKSLREHDISKALADANDDDDINLAIALSLKDQRYQQGDTEEDTRVKKVSTGTSQDEIQTQTEFIPFGDVVDHLSTSNRPLPVKRSYKPNGAKPAVHTYAKFAKAIAPRDKENVYKKAYEDVISTSCSLLQESIGEHVGSKEDEQSAQKNEPDTIYKQKLSENNISPEPSVAVLDDFTELSDEHRLHDQSKHSVEFRVLFPKRDTSQTPPDKVSLSVVEGKNVNLPPSPMPRIPRPAVPIVIRENVRRNQNSDSHSDELHSPVKTETSSTEVVLNKPVDLGTYKEDDLVKFSSNFQLNINSSLTSPLNQEDDVDALSSIQGLQNKRENLEDAITRCLVDRGVNTDASLLQDLMALITIDHEIDKRQNESQKTDVLLDKEAGGLPFKNKKEAEKMVLDLKDKLLAQRDVLSKSELQALLHDHIANKKDLKQQQNIQRQKHNQKITVKLKAKLDKPKGNYGKEPVNDNSDDELLAQYASQLEAIEGELIEAPLVYSDSFEEDSEKEDIPQQETEESSKLRLTLTQDIKEHLDNMSAGDFKELMNMYREKKLSMDHGDKNRNDSLWRSLKNDEEDARSNAQSTKVDEGQLEKDVQLYIDEGLQVSFPKTDQDEQRSKDDEFIQSIDSKRKQISKQDFGTILAEHMERMSDLRRHKDNERLERQRKIAEKLERMHTGGNMSSQLDHVRGSSTDMLLCSIADWEPQLSDIEDDVTSVAPLPVIEDEQLAEELEELKNKYHKIISRHKENMKAERLGAFMERYRQEQQDIIDKKTREKCRNDSRLKEKLKERLRNKNIQLPKSDSNEFPTTGEQMKESMDVRSSFDERLAKIDEDFYKNLVDKRQKENLTGEDIEALIHQHLQQIDHLKQKHQYNHNLENVKKEKRKELRAKRKKELQEQTKEKAKELVAEKEETRRQALKLRLREKERTDLLLKDKLQHRKQKLH